MDKTMHQNEKKEQLTSENRAGTSINTFQMERGDGGHG